LSRSSSEASCTKHSPLGLPSTPKVKWIPLGPPKMMQSTNTKTCSSIIKTPQRDIAQLLLKINRASDMVREKKGNYAARKVLEEENHLNAVQHN
jgi:hypothetical protein